MKSKLLTGFLFLQFFCACSNSDSEKTTTPPASENDVDAARNFIDAVLQSDFKKARTFIINDSLNNQYLDATERSFTQKFSAADRDGYKNASITVLAVKPQNDSVSIIDYSNSYKKEKERIKVLKQNGQWLVDLKYTFSAAKDSLP